MRLTFAVTLTLNPKQTAAYLNEHGIDAGELRTHLDDNLSNMLFNSTIGEFTDISVRLDLRSERPTYTWTVDGERCGGTLHDYARHWAESQISSVHVSGSVVDEDREIPVKVRKLSSHNDGVAHAFSADMDLAIVSVDGRA